MSEKKGFQIREETRARCKIFDLDPSTSKKFVPISMDFFHFLFLVDQIDFSIYVRVGDTLIEFMRKEEFSKELLTQIGAAMGKANTNTSVCIQRVDRPRFDSVIERVRAKQMLSLREKQPDLNPKVLDIYSSISSASQMIVRGGITSGVAERVKASAAAMVSNLVDSNAAIDTLSRMITCDPTLYDHSATVAMLAAVIGQNIPGKRLAQSEIECIGQCALYHDVGKTCVPNHVLNKPGKLTPEEFDVIKTHTVLGNQEIIEANKGGAGIVEIAARVALEHHEKFHGGGYPHNRQGRFEDDPVNGIHLYTRIVSIADVYSALLMKRVYKPAYEPQDAIKLMAEFAKDFDPVLFTEFLRSVVKSLNARQEQASGKGRILQLGDTGQLVEVKKSS